MNDLISRQAAIDALKGMAVPLYKDPACEDIWERDRTLDNAIDAIRGLPSAQPEHTETHSCDYECTETHESRREWYMKGYRDAQPKWIPIKWHDCTAEEREEYGFGEEIVAVFDCDMPSDNQGILVTTSHGYVEEDVCYIDDGYSLDSGYDWIEDITAWMPLPKPYKESEE